MARALHPDVEALRAAAAAAGAPAFDTLGVADMRRAYAVSRAALQAPFVAVEEVRDLVMAGPVGSPLRLRLFRGVPAGSPAPCLLFLHGGGFVVGNLDTHEGLCRRLAADAGCCVVSVDYRLAPEHPFPAAVEDAAAALRHVAAEAVALGVDAGRLAVGGDSAGGTLAAVLALMGRDGTVPAPACQLLFYPATDLRPPAEDEGIAPGMPLTPAGMRRFIELYAADPDDWRASPLRAESLAGTAPALVLTCGHDPLCREGRLYAERLEREGVAVTAVHLSDQTHGILTMDGRIGAVAPAVALAAAVLRDAWRPLSA